MKMVQREFRETKTDDFKNPKPPKKPSKTKGPREFVTEISIPTIGQFKQYLGKRFLEIYGPRKLCSLIQRCSAQGPWAEKIEIMMKKKSGESKKIACSKLEYELTKLQRINQSHVSQSLKNPDRYEELQFTMSPNLMAKSDKELFELCEKWIEGFNEPDIPVSHV